MATFTAPTNPPAPLSPLVPLNSPMVGAASPFDHADGQNRDLILEAIRTWASLNLLTWSSAWQSFFTTWLPAAQQYINTNAVTGHSWRTTTTPISLTLPTLVTVVGGTTAAPLAVGDLIVDSTADSNYGIVTAVTDATHATVAFIGFLHGVAGPNSLPADTAVAGFISTTGTSLTKTALINRAIVLNVGDYGAIGDGVTDDTAAIQAAYNALPAVGGTLTGRGTFLVSTFVPWAKSVVFQGVGRYATVFKTTSAAGDVFTLNGKGSGFNNVGFDSAPTRSAGAFIKISGMSYGAITDVHLAHYYIGIDIDSTTGYNITNISALDGTASSVAVGGGVIRLGKTAYTGGINIRGVLANVNVAANQPSYGINLGNVDVCSISGALIIHHGDALSLTPNGASQFVTQLEVTDSCFDTSGRGLVIAPTNSGFVSRCGFNNTWFGAHSGDGAYLTAASPTLISGVAFTNCQFHANAGNGINLSGAGINGVYFSQCFAAGNSGNGVTINGALQANFSGGAFGPISGIAGNVGYGMAVTAGSTGSANNVKLDGNSLANLNNATTAFIASEPQSFASTISATTGALAAATATVNYTVTGRIVNFDISAAISNNGTGAGAVTITLPYPAIATNAYLGRETALSGGSLQCILNGGSSTLQIYKIDGGTYPGGTGTAFVTSGSYRRA